MKRIRLTLEWGEIHRPEEVAPDREGSADALVERADPWMPPLGFGPPPPREDA